MSVLELKFKLQTSTSADDFVKLILPFPLHSKLTAAYSRPSTVSQAFDLFLTYREKTQDGEYSDTGAQKGIVLTETADSSTYFI